MENRQQNRKRTGLLVALALCCILAVGGGVMAWFSITTEKTNTFTDGSGITEPDKKPDPGNPQEGGSEDNEKGDQWIVETEWEENSPITPGSIVPKNPNVGIGKGSKDAFVFVEVENGLGNDAYFVLGKNWVPVAGRATLYGGDKDVTIPSENHGRCYKEGLFVYVGQNSQATDENGMAQLIHDADGLKDKYTGEVFDKIYANNYFVLGTGKTIEVKAYLASASQKELSGQNEAKTKSEIIAKAKNWADEN